MKTYIKRNNLMILQDIVQLEGIGIFFLPQYIYIRYIFFDFPLFIYIYIYIYIYTYIGHIKSQICCENEVINILL